MLVVLAAVISIPLSIAIGSYAALHRERTFDTVVSNVMLALASLPEFVVALLLVILFSTSVFHVLPGDQSGAPRHRAWEYPDELILPVATLVIAVDAVRLPDHAGLHGRGARERLRRDGPAQGPVRAHRARPARAAERHRPGVPGDRRSTSPTSPAASSSSSTSSTTPASAASWWTRWSNHDIPVVQALAMLIAGFYVCSTCWPTWPRSWSRPDCRTRL